MVEWEKDNIPADVNVKETQKTFYVKTINFREIFTLI